MMNWLSILAMDGWLPIISELIPTGCLPIAAFDWEVKRENMIRGGRRGRLGISTEVSRFRLVALDSVSGSPVRKEQPRDHDRNHAVHHDIEEYADGNRRQLVAQRGLGTLGVGELRDVPDKE